MDSLLVALSGAGGQQGGELRGTIFGLDWESWLSGSSLCLV